MTLPTIELRVVHALATLPLAGLIWTVQLVHYPLFEQVGEEAWPAYHRRHCARMSWLVGPLMAVEALAAALLLTDAWQRGDRAALETAGALLVLVHGASTAFVQMPLHAALGRGFDRRRIALLVSTNWVRTLAWSARAWIAVELLRR